MGRAKLQLALYRPPPDLTKAGFFMNFKNFLKNPYFFISPSWHVIGCGFDDNAVNFQLRKKCEIHVSADGLFTSTLCAILVDLPLLSVN